MLLLLLFINLYGGCQVNWSTLDTPATQWSQYWNYSKSIRMCNPTSPCSCVNGTDAYRCPKPDSSFIWLATDSNFNSSYLSLPANNNESAIYNGVIIFGIRADCFPGLLMPASNLTLILGNTIIWHLPLAHQCKVFANYRIVYVHVDNVNADSDQLTLIHDYTFDFNNHSINIFLDIINITLTC